MSTWRDRQVKLRCYLCGGLNKLDRLVSCGYESEDGCSAGSGLVCLSCLDDVPTELLVEDRDGATRHTWPLVFRAP